ncbi:MAG: long-chain fatty acid--CoA ligase [Sphingobium sp.]|nr:long-chain fatty acid--CoA ligase [Sphingobium sp.]MCP5397856.1 long-chain fatty acid--CoA ligase [Sphingomonas sp.]
MSNRHGKALSTAILDLGLADDSPLIIGSQRAVHVRDAHTIAVSSDALAGRRVALCMTQPHELVSAILACDGRAEAMLLLAPDLPAEHVAALAMQADIGLIISDRDDIDGAQPWQVVIGTEATRDIARAGDSDVDTHWLLTTSGTTGLPKMVAHDRASILRAVRTSESSKGARWAMLYDPSRFAGTQVLVQALLSGGMVLVPDPDMSLSESVAWLAGQGCTHISATPSLWRRILMAPASRDLPLRQITLGGEIADEAILTALAARFPDARITHIYASTETGTGFSVQDGKAGFPAGWLEGDTEDVALSLRDGVLWLRPPAGAATHGDHIERDEAGYICTRDAVELRGDRVYFLGREDASVNVGGVKVQIEAVEEVVHRHAQVAQCHISAKPNPIMGNLLSLSVVPRDAACDAAVLRKDITAWCKQHLPRAAQPATIRIVDEIAVTAAGKVERAQ